MTALELYKFVTKKELEHRWEKEDVLLFIPIGDLLEWNELLGAYLQGDDPLTCYMRDGYFVFCMQGICDYFDLSLEEIFGEDKDS